jgi:hypothetical protein
MKLLLIEKEVKIHSDFQKLLNNSIRIYGESKSEKVTIITKDIIVFQDINFNKNRREYNLDYNCYVFLDVSKWIYSDKDVVSAHYFKLFNNNNAYRSWNKPSPFLSNFRTDYDKFNNISLMFLSFSYSDMFFEYHFKKNSKDICHKMENKLISYAKDLTLQLDGALIEQHFL